MSDRTPQETASISASISASDGNRRPRAIRRLVVAVAVACTATVALSAWSGHGPHMGGPGEGRMGGPGMMGGFGGAGLFMGPGANNPEHMSRMIDRMLDGLNATDAQRAQIKEIARLAAVDLKAQRDKDDGRALRDKGLQLFSAPTIDAGAVDSLRLQVQAQRDQSARRVMQAMIDIGRVLTPEQRVTAARLVKFQSDRRDDEMKRMREHPEADGRRGRHEGPMAPPEPAPAR